MKWSDSDPIHPTRKYFYQMKLLRKDHEIIKRMLRVNHSGEIGANYIYKGQFAAVPTQEIQHMWDQEKEHLRVFDAILPATRTRPSLLRSFWELSGYAMGRITGQIGATSAMACTEAVETVIGDHYNDQIRILVDMKSRYPDQDTSNLDTLMQVIKKFRDEELEHKEIAIEHESQTSPGYSLLSNTIQAVCKTAIQIAHKV